MSMRSSTTSLGISQSGLVLHRLPRPSDAVGDSGIPCLMAAHVQVERTKSCYKYWLVVCRSAFSIDCILRSVLFNDVIPLGFQCREDASMRPGSYVAPKISRLALPRVRVYTARYLSMLPGSKLPSNLSFVSENHPQWGSLWNQLINKLGRTANGLSFPAPGPPLRHRALRRTF